jgi:putative DNA primase/helicase
MKALLRSWPATLGGDVSGKGVVCPGPRHSSRDRSLAVKVGASGEILVHSFAGDDWRECRDYVSAKLGIADRKMRARIEPCLDRDTGVSRATEFALKLWASSVDPHGTLADLYLRGRRLK